MPFYDTKGNLLTSLSEHIGLAPKQIIQVAGAGGKTTLTAVLAAENRDKKVCVTTTTKRYRPDDKSFVTIEDERLTPERLKKAERSLHINDLSEKTDTKNQKLSHLGNVRNERTCGYVEAGKYVTDRKVCYPGKENLVTLIDWADLTIIEADGSRRLPLKCVYPHEPVFVQEIFCGVPLSTGENKTKSQLLNEVFTKHPGLDPKTISTSLSNQENNKIRIPVSTIIVVGLNSIGLKMRDACYGYELFCDEIQEDEEITPEIIAYLSNRFFLEPFRRLNPLLVLSHADTSERIRAGVQIFSELKHNGVLMDVNDINCACRVKN